MTVKELVTSLASRVLTSRDNSSPLDERAGASITQKTDKSFTVLTGEKELFFVEVTFLGKYTMAFVPSPDLKLTEAIRAEMDANYYNKK